jgi:hypothetical protein
VKFLKYFYFDLKRIKIFIKVNPEESQSQFYFMDLGLNIISPHIDDVRGQNLTVFSFSFPQTRITAGNTGTPTKKRSPVKLIIFRTSKTPRLTTC